MLARLLCEFAIKAQDLLPHSRMVEAEPRRGLGVDDMAVVGDKARVGMLDADPVRSGIDVYLNDHLQACLACQLQDLAQVAQVVLVWLRLCSAPVYPALDGVETQLFDLTEVCAPGLAVRVWIGLQHRSPGLTSSIPDCKWEEWLLSLAARLPGGRVCCLKTGAGPDGE